MEFWQFSLIMFGLLFLIVQSQKIIDRLSSQSKGTKFAARPIGAKDFAIWLTVDDGWLDQFQMGHIDDWETGLSFAAFGDATIKHHPNGLTVGEVEEEKRATFNFYPSLDAFSKNIIGSGKIGEKSAELFVGLTPSGVSILLNEIRLSPKASLHAQGYTTEEGKIRLTYFTFSPKAHQMSLNWPSVNTDG